MIEDEPVGRGLIAEVLTEIGQRPLENVDVSKWLEILQSNRQIDLLSTEIGLPALNGRQALRVQAVRVGSGRDALAI